MSELGNSLTENAERSEGVDQRVYPDWTPSGLLPNYLHRGLCGFRGEHFEDFVYTLATDLRMKNVWANLLLRLEKKATASPLPDQFQRIRIDGFPLLIAELLYRSLYKPSSVDEAAQVNTGKRLHLLERIRSSAKELRCAMEELKLPADIYHYADDGHNDSLSEYLTDFLLKNFWWADEEPETPDWVVDFESGRKFLEENPLREMPEWAPQEAKQISRTTLSIGNWPRIDLHTILKNIGNVEVLETMLPSVMLKKDGSDNPRTYAIRVISATFANRFGSPLYESVATIMSVALGEDDFSRDNVRSALKGFDFPRSN